MTCTPHADDVCIEGMGCPCDVPQGCERGWELLNRKCYKISNDEQMKFDAHAICKESGSLLMLITSDEENEFARGLLTGDKKSAWLRINDSKNEGVWVVDVEVKPSDIPASYFHFNPNSPNTDVINSAVIEKDGNWKVVDKYYLSHYICEKNSVPVSELGKIYTFTSLLPY